MSISQRLHCHDGVTRASLHISICTYGWRRCRQGPQKALFTWHQEPVRWETTFSQSVCPAAISKTEQGALFGLADVELDCKFAWTRPCKGGKKHTGRKPSKQDLTKRIFISGCIAGYALPRVVDKPPSVSMFFIRQLWRSGRASH